MTAINFALPKGETPDGTAATVDHNDKTLTKGTSMKFANRLHSIAFAITATATALTGVAHADDLADIKSAGVINVGIFPDFPPFPRQRPT